MALTILPLSELIWSSEYEGMWTHIWLKKRIHSYVVIMSQQGNCKFRLNFIHSFLSLDLPEILDVRKPCTLKNAQFSRSHSEKDDIFNNILCKGASIVWKTSHVWFWLCWTFFFKKQNGKWHLEIQSWVCTLNAFCSSSLEWFSDFRR